MRDIYALRTSKNTYKFINLKKVMNTAGEFATVLMFFAVIWLMMFI